MLSALVLRTGFRALSDDDYARVVIAQAFAQAPAFDPSGTSWLPVPFWVYGSLLAVFGPSLEAARVIAVGLGVVSALLVYVAASFMGSSRGAALVSALVAAVLPYSAWLGVATVPDAPVAALLVLGVAGAASGDERRRLLAALALAVAVGCRYEAWPVAAGFAALSLWDGFKCRRLMPVASGAVALLPAGLWMVHGVFTHGSALFFVRRVGDYQKALGIDLPPGIASLLHYPSLLLRFEPGLLLVTLVVLAWSWRLGQKETIRHYRRPLLLLGLLLAFLMSGDVRGSGPTHHPERTLLSIWWLCAIVSIDLMTRSLAPLRERFRRTSGALLGSAVFLMVFARPWLGSGGFAERDAEIGIGEAARNLVPRAARLAVYTPDYGFFAVLAAFGAPSRAQPIDDQDPRGQRSDVLDSRQALEDWLRREKTSWFIVPAEHVSILGELAEVRAQNEKFALLKLR